MSEARRVVVVGSGFAGCSAAFRLKEERWNPVVVSAGVGASSMTSGAADLRPWTEESRGVVSPMARAFVRTLGLFDESGFVATSEGFIRPTDGVGARVLSLGALQGKVVGVANLPRVDFRPEEMVRKLSATSWARQTRTCFEVVEVPGVVSVRELSYPLAAFHRLFDEEWRLETLRRSAQALSPKIQGLLTGPFLGSGVSSLDVPGVVIGETLSPPEGSFGGRVEAARNAWIERAGIEMREELVSRLNEEDGCVRVSIASAEKPSGDKARATLWADAVVLASGGLIGHGVDSIARAGTPAALGAALDPAPPALLGASEGWDATEDGGLWVHPPHYRKSAAREASSRIVLAGDVRGDAGSGSPGGTVFGAISSGLEAAQQLMAR